MRRIVWHTSRCIDGGGMIRCGYDGDSGGQLQVCVSYRYVTVCRDDEPMSPSLAVIACRAARLQ